MIVNSSQGGGSKDTWVLEDGRGRAATATATPACSGSSPRRMPGLRYGGEWHGQQQQQQQQPSAADRAPPADPPPTTRR